MGFGYWGTIENIQGYMYIVETCVVVQLIIEKIS